MRHTERGVVGALACALALAGCGRVDRYKGQAGPPIPPPAGRGEPLPTGESLVFPGRGGRAPGMVSELTGGEAMGSIAGNVASPLARPPADLRAKQDLYWKLRGMTSDASKGLVKSDLGLWIGRLRDRSRRTRPDRARDLIEEALNLLEQGLDAHQRERGEAPTGTADPKLDGADPTEGLGSAPLAPPGLGDLDRMPELGGGGSEALPPMTGGRGTSATYDRLTAFHLAAMRVDDLAAELGLDKP